MPVRSDISMHAPALLKPFVQVLALYKCFTKLNFHHSATCNVMYSYNHACIIKQLSMQKCILAVLF